MLFTLNTPMCIKNFIPGTFQSAVIIILLSNFYYSGPSGGCAGGGHGYDNAKSDHMRVSMISDIMGAGGGKTLVVSWLPPPLMSTKKPYK